MHPIPLTVALQRKVICTLAFNLCWTSTVATASLTSIPLPTASGMHPFTDIDFKAPVSLIETLCQCLTSITPRIEIFSQWRTDAFRHGRVSSEVIDDVGWRAPFYILNYENFVVQLLSRNQLPRLHGSGTLQNPVKAADEHYFWGWQGGCVQQKPQPTRLPGQLSSTWASQRGSFSRWFYR